MKTRSETVHSGETHVSATAENMDAAWTFLQSHGHVEMDSLDLRALRRKIDWHIVPLMFCCYTMQFLDKVILNVRFRIIDAASV